MKRMWILAALCVSLLIVGGPAAAATRAWLDREQVEVGQTVVLSIETDQAGGSPDLSGLMADFVLEGQSSNQSMQWNNGQTQRRTTFEISLAPKREGRLSVPPISIGGEQSQPLELTVSAAAAPAVADGSAGAYLETEIDDASPYVQQSVGVIVRLLYSVPLASGQLDLDPPEGASLQRIGEDAQSSREINGRRYNVVERKYLLIPERSGALTLPGPRFKGRGVGGWMDDFLGGNSRELRANGAPKTIQVSAQPDNAPQPWLPLRDLRLRYVSVPQSLRAGEAGELVVEAIAQGATQAQMPELPAPVIAGAQVFAEPPQYDETFNGGSPQVKLTRRFSIVPNAAGKLAVPGMKLGWWDVRASAAKFAALPDLALEATPGSGSFAAPAAVAAGAAPDAISDNALSLQPTAQAPTPDWWRWLAFGFAGLWLLTVAWLGLWWWQRRRAPAAPPGPVGRGSVAATATHTAADLKRALDTGDLEDVATALCGMATPPCVDLDALLARLDSSAQRDAIEQLQRARWADGDGVAARAALREAFRNGPDWRRVPQVAREILEPLYPRR